MKSEDIARYVAGLEAEVKRLSVGTASDTSRVNLNWAIDLDALGLTDTPPDTSRVTFGARHEGTGMVLLQHADLPGDLWGVYRGDDTELHRRLAVNDPKHAALAEVREALNTAEAAGVDVRDGFVVCNGSFAGADDLTHRATWRARRYLAREVQALVDQDLRGDDLNAAVPFEVRDHRTPGLAALASHYGVSHSVMGTFLNGPVEAADTSSDASEVEVLISALNDGEDISDYHRAIRALDAHRAARTSITDYNDCQECARVLEAHRARTIKGGVTA